ncbi:helix-turn-helix transcriptional regulator [Neptunicoccus cionae]|uniref:helix-turn-helix transcriptional regulator n=1 Tax=Neptunicoccus cionae TaxID=2035344 RepID=UPI000C786BE5|nr:autoinducer binding domain-containing protein [Amylibacter cionae]PLS22299.1 LuxR family transcriptional regulator [Amylibacter cionae]
MQNQIETFLERVEHCKSLVELNAVVAGLRDIFQVNHVVYHSVNSTGEPYALATYDQQWAEYYESEALYRVDPVVLGAFQRFHPYNWKSLDWEKKTARQFFQEAQDGGVGNQGVSVPVRGPNGEFALFSISHTCSDEAWARFLSAHMPNFLLIGHYIHASIRALEFPETVGSYVVLSPRETDALRLLGAGLNRGRAAEQLKISEHTLRVYIESARSKLNASNTTHAVAKALAQGLINI